MFNHPVLYVTDDISCEKKMLSCDFFGLESHTCITISECTKVSRFCVIFKVEQPNMIFEKGSGGHNFT